MTEKRKKLPPVVMAVIIQSVALPLCITVYTVWLANLSNPPPVYVLFLMQALFASLCAYLIHEEFWWVYIHLTFPLIAGLLMLLNIPSNVYLAAFMVSTGLFWTTFITRVPFYPSKPVIWNQVAAIVPNNKKIRMIDIGSGLGDLVFKVSELRPECEISGIEIAPIPWLISYLRKFFNRSRATVRLGNYHHLDFSKYDVIFAYLSPAAMTALWTKAQAEMNEQSLLVSHAFEIANVQPSMTIQESQSTSQTYVYAIKR